MKISKKPMPSRKHIPLRKCIACAQARPKRELIRLVHTSGGMVEVDFSGKKAGRGAYLCPAPSCWESGLKKNRLDHALHMELNADNRALLTEFSKRIFSLSKREGNGEEKSYG